MKQIYKLSQELDKHLLETPIKETGEEMTLLSGLALNKKNLNLKPYLRKSVAESLAKAGIELSRKGYSLVVEDAYRSLARQKERFQIRFQEMKDLQKANTFTAGIPILAAHTSGAAVDVTLADQDMGSKYPEACPEAKTDCLSLNPKIIKLRKMLCSVMEKHGFVNYPFEWWHFSMGDVCAAYLKNEPFAVYTPLEFDPETKNMKFLEIDKYYQYFEV